MKPFDLEAAKRGEPIITRDGREAKLLAYEPDLGNLPVVVMIAGSVTQMTKNGSWVGDNSCSCDLFMAPKKRTVWVNFYSNRESVAYYYDTENDADYVANGRKRIGNKAYPVETEE
jgi:hypothetical protein